MMRSFFFFCPSAAKGLLYLNVIRPNRRWKEIRDFKIQRRDGDKNVA